MRLSWSRNLLAMAATIALAAVAGGSLASADTPPSPDFYWPYGKVLANGANLSPPVQTVVGMANGRACGVDQTLVASAGANTPADDVGKTVYVVNILADGAGAGQRKGCGRSGDPVVIYFPESHRVGTPSTTFKQGGERVDLDAGTFLSFRLNFPYASSDGIY